MILKENTKEVLTSSQKAYEIFKAILDARQEEDKHKEFFYVMGLNGQNIILYVDLIAMGTVNQANPFIRECLRLAIVKNAVSIVVCHNHPSGAINPSNEDKEFTRRLKEAGVILSINLLDHIILGENKFFSFSDSGEII